jgi:hypothetical protein
LEEHPVAIEQTAAQGATGPLGAVRASDAERRELTALLKQACVDGRLTLDEFGERMDRAIKARTRSELDELVRDLPAPSHTNAALVTAPSAAHSRPAVSRTLAILSSADRTGVWRIGQKSRAIAFMGSCKLDLRRATISAPVTVIDVHVLMGNVNVIVPEGVEVELDATPIMGSRSLKLKGKPPEPGAPVVVIRGLVVMGDLTVRDRPRT